MLKREDGLCNAISCLFNSVLIKKPLGIPTTALLPSGLGSGPLEWPLSPLYFSNTYSVLVMSFFVFREVLGCHTSCSFHECVSRGERGKQ